jgi:hypothetical protein
MNLINAINNYIDLLLSKNLNSPKVLREGKINDINTIEKQLHINFHPDLITYFQRVGGYSPKKCNELDSFEPSFLFNMHAIQLKQVLQHYSLAGEKVWDDELEEETDTYYPIGFIPFLLDGAGNYILINCIANSPTYGGIYYLESGLGCIRLSDSLSQFIIANHKTIEQYSKDFSNQDFFDITYEKDYFGDVPYFNSSLKRVDWQ